VPNKFLEPGFVTRARLQPGQKAAIDERALAPVCPCFPRMFGLLASQKSKAKQVFVRVEVLIKQELRFIVVAKQMT
jgi:hypothetical protein